MATCKYCGHDVIQVQYGQATLVLDPCHYAYAPVAEHHIWAEDGDRVLMTTGLVEHRVVCVKQRQEQERAQAAYRAKHQEKGAVKP